MLHEYKFLLHTTKRHREPDNPTVDRFRIILPTSHILHLNAVDYKEFMENIFEWLPFNCDTQTGQRSRKWLCNSKSITYNEGKLLNILPFIPKTEKNKKRKNALKANGSLNNVERWFIEHTNNGNRNNQVLKYALMLVDSGRDYNTVRKEVLEFNKKLPYPLTENEIDYSIMLTVGKKLNRRRIQ